MGEVRMPISTKRKLNEIKKIKDVKSALEEIIDTIKNYAEEEKKVPVKYNSKTGKPLKFKWIPYEKFKWRFSFNAGDRFDKNLTLHSSVRKYIQKNSPLLISHNDGQKYLFTEIETSSEHREGWSTTDHFIQINLVKKMI